MAIKKRYILALLTGVVVVAAAWIAIDKYVTWPRHLQKLVLGTVATSPFDIPIYDRYGGFEVKILWTYEMSPEICARLSVKYQCRTMGATDYAFKCIDVDQAGRCTIAQRHYNEGLILYVYYQDSRLNMMLE